MTPGTAPAQAGTGPLRIGPSQVIGARLCCYALAILSALVLGPQPRTLGVAITAGAATLQLGFLLLPARRRANPAYIAFDLVFAVTLALAVPELWHTALLVLVAASVPGVATMTHASKTVFATAPLIDGALAAGVAALGEHWRQGVVIGLVVALLSARGSLVARHLLTQTDRHLVQALDASRAVIQTVDVDTGVIVDLAGDVAEVTGWPTDEWRVKRADDAIHPDDVPAWAEAIAQLEHSPEFDFVGRLFGKQGELRWLRYTGQVDTDPMGRRLLSGMLADVTAINQANQEMHDLVRRDRITGLPNRQRLEEDLDEQAVQAGSFALLIADIREFKAINDTLGHHIGDLVLSMTGTRLGQHGADRTVYRLSGDQFAVVLHGVTEAEQALAVGRQIVSDCRRPYYVGRVALGAPVAVGLALSSANVAPSLTLRQADVALNAAKAANSGVEMFHPDMQRFTLENLMLSAAVEHGLDAGEFVLHFQPQVDLRTGQIVGAEGLVRWNHPERGVLPPYEFLDTLRVSASFDRFTVAMVRQAALAAVAARGAPQAIAFAANIEMGLLLNPGFTDKLIAELGRHDLGHHHVVLEVTETALADSVVANSPIDPLVELERLREAGYQIAIDDFGTGSSSLARLDRLPVDEVKIDRAFVSALGSNPRSEMLLASIIQLGGNLGLRIVAEGIEELTQLAFLVEAECTVGQGWLFAKAMPLPEFLSGVNTRYPVTGADKVPAPVTTLRAVRGETA